MEQPLCLAIEEVKREFISLINRATSESHLPFYILELILADGVRQVAEYAKAERVNATVSYEANKKKEKENDGNNEHSTGCVRQE